MVDTCVMCGACVPEGRMVCPMCEHFSAKPHAKDKKSFDSEDFFRAAVAKSRGKK